MKFYRVVRHEMKEEPEGSELTGIIEAHYFLVSQDGLEDPSADVVAVNFDVFDPVFCSERVNHPQMDPPNVSMISGVITHGSRDYIVTRVTEIMNHNDVRLIVAMNA